MRAYFDHLEGMSEADAGDVALADLPAIDSDLRDRRCFMADMNGDSDSYLYAGYRLEVRGERAVVVFLFGDEEP